MRGKDTARKKSSYTKVSQNSLSQEQLTEMIHKVAYEIYEKKGCTPGDEMEDWLEAERRVNKELQPDILQKKGKRKIRNVE